MTKAECMLKGELMKRGFSIPKLCDITGISRKRMYSHLKGNNFTQNEISLIAEAVGFTDDELLTIFFNNKVS